MTLNPCKEREPKVINNSLLEKAILEQIPKGEVGNLARAEGVPFEEVEQIRLEFMNVLKLDHLWVMPALTKLCVNNNLIEKIENLESLVNLKELDLSFNKIKKIENLDRLEKLEKLSLFENLICEIENLYTLSNLGIFSIGRNRIEHSDNILYLRRFKNLLSLNMAGNPCAEEENFRIYIAVFLPNLIYYEYKKISLDERQQGQQLFRKELRQLEELEQKEKEVRDEEEKMKADAALHSVSFVEYLNTKKLFAEMFQSDAEGKAFLEIGEEIEENYNDFEEQFVHVCLQIFNVGQEQYRIRKAEVDQFTKCVEEAKIQNQNVNIAAMEIFFADKAKVFSEIVLLQDKLDENVIDFKTYDEQSYILEERFNEIRHRTWKSLMKSELDLYEQMEDVNQQFEQTLTDMVNQFVEAAQGYFSQIRELEGNYSEAVSDAGQRYLTTLTLNPSLRVPSSLVQIMSDKEAVANAIGASHDTHLLVIDNREDMLVNRAKEWLSELVDNLTKDEIKRNRNKVLEINFFLDKQRAEFLDLINGAMKTDSTLMIKN